MYMLLAAAFLALFSGNALAPPPSQGIVWNLHIPLLPSLPPLPPLPPLPGDLPGMSQYNSLMDSIYGPKPMPPPIPSNATVSYDHRGIIIDGKRRLLLAGSIHYPRSTPGMWPFLLARAKAAGLNAVDTYVFWNLHEPTPGEYDFETDEKNLPLFLQLAHEAGLYVVLRIGPYICAEFNNGGFPAWLTLIKDIKTRTYNEAFMVQMVRFVRKTMQVVDPYLKRNGGPIILLQMENEYANVMWFELPYGQKYISWAAYLAQSIDVGLPWFMSQQGEVRSVINTCNGFYCDNWIDKSNRLFPNHPKMHSELWTGWFQLSPEPLTSRPATDVAFACARFIARGGSYIGYYMWHGGTNFGRNGGGMMATSYDYDAPLNEYGFPHNPKHQTLTDLHDVLNQFEDVIMSTESIDVISTGVDSTEAHIYWGKNRTSGRAIAFLSNIGKIEQNVQFQSKIYKLPSWSVALVVRESQAWTIAFNTRDAEAKSKAMIGTAPLHSVPSNCSAQPGVRPQNSTHAIIYTESFSASEPSGFDRLSSSFADKTFGPMVSDGPLEQLRITMDKTDYLWYVRENVHVGSSSTGSGSSSLTVTFGGDSAIDFSHIWLNDTYLGSLNSVQKTLQVSNPSPSGVAPGVLSILSTAMGMVHFDPHLENMKKGLTSSVSLNNMDVTTGSWKHFVGLVGEHLNWNNPSLAVNSSWTSLKSSSSLSKPLTWYYLKFPISSFCLPQDFGPGFKHSGESSMPSYALYIGGMTKGVVWVNGRNIGRYWTAPSTFKSSKWNLPFGLDGNRGKGSGDACPPVGQPDCDYSSSYFEMSCRHGCGDVVQPFMHVPFDWVSKTVEDGIVSVVLFDESGGANVSNAHFVRMAG